MYKNYIKTMFCSVLLFITVNGAFSANQQPADLLIKNGDRVVFYGDSITDSEWYPTLVETYVLTRYPQWRNHFFNRGVSGDNSGSIARFNRDVIENKADLFIYNMGFNDGGYSALTSGSLEKWLANIDKSVTMAKQASPKMRMALASPITNETSVSADTRWVSHEVYPYTMLSFGREEEKLAKKLNIPFVDTGLLYGQCMGLGKVAAGATFQLSRDGVHPQREGQTLIAFHLLQGIGADSLVSATEIDTINTKVAENKRCTITGLKINEGIVTFQQLCESLPYPTPTEARPFAFLVRLDDNLSADLLKVTGLTAPSYKLSIDNKYIATISTAELNDGLNISRYTNTPMYEQALKVMEAVRTKQTIETTFWRQYIFAGKADGTGKATDKATPDDIIAINAANKAIDAAEIESYALNTPKQHTFILEPATSVISRYDALVAASINQAPLNISMTPLDADWNQMKLLKNEVTVTITNPGIVTSTGILNWECPNGWTAIPAESAFTVEAGKRVSIKFTLNANGGDTLMPAPVVTAKWRWCQDWAYPMILSRTVEITPQLTINYSKTKPELTGKMDDWKDATTFALDKNCYINPAVPGKKALWGGPADLSGKFFLKWDETALYLAALVSDSEHIQQANEMMAWSQDVLMPAFLMSETGKPDGRYELAFCSYPDKDTIYRYWNSAKDAVGADMQFKSTVSKENGTVFYEIIIPWNRLAPFKPAQGKMFRSTVVVSDSDSQPGKGFNYLAWTPGIHYGKNPADFARLVLGTP